MEGGHHRDALVVDPMAAGADDAGVAAQEETERHLPQTHDDLGADELDFLGQPNGAAKVSLVHGGRPIAPGPALHDIRHVHMVPRDAHRRQRLVQELPRGTHQRSAVLILHAPRPLADDHQRRIRRPRGEHRPPAALAPKRAAPASGDGLLQDRVRG